MCRLPRVRSACGIGFELIICGITVADWLLLWLATAQAAIGTLQNFNSKPFPQADLMRGTAITG